MRAAVAHQAAYRLAKASGMDVAHSSCCGSISRERMESPVHAKARRSGPTYRRKTMNDEYTRRQDQDYYDDDDERIDEDLRDRGDKNAVKGKMNEASGKVQEKFGDLTDNERMEAEGKMKQWQGEAQQDLRDTELDLGDDNL